MKSISENPDKSRARQATLEKIGAANQRPVHGPGIRAEEFVPLAQYYSRMVAEKLIGHLRYNGIETRYKTGRMITSIEVAFHDRQSAFRLLEEFKERHADIKPRGIPRDCDVFLLVGAIAFVPAVVFWLAPSVPRSVTWAWLLTNLVVAVVLERLLRNYRHYHRLRFSIWDVCILILLASILASVWKYAL